MPYTAEKIDLKILYLLQRRGIKEVIKWCMEQGLIADIYICPKCSKPMELVECLELQDQYQWRCNTRRENEKPHNYVKSIRKGSVFQYSSLNLSTVLIMTFMWVKNLPYPFIMHELDLNRRTISNWAEFCREICIEMCIRESEMIGGPERTVEIQEFVLVRQKHKDNKKLVKYLYAGIDCLTKKCFFKVIIGRKVKALLSAVCEWILPDTRVASDCWKKYSCLSDKSFCDLASEKNLVFIDAQRKSGQSTWDIIRNHVMKVKGNVEFSRCMLEYLWRRSHTDDPEGLFDAFLEAIIEVYPPDIGVFDKNSPIVIKVEPDSTSLSNNCGSVGIFPD